MDESIMKNGIPLAILTVAFALLPVSAQAFPIALPGTEGNMVIVSGTDDVIATYQGNSASFSNDLYVTLSIGGSETFIFNNHEYLFKNKIGLSPLKIFAEGNKSNRFLFEGVQTLIF